MNQNDRTQQALDSFCKGCPDVKMIKAYEHQPNDDRRLMKIAYFAYVDGENIDAQAFKTSGANNNDMGLGEVALKDWAESAKRVFDQFMSAIKTIDSLDLLKR